MRIEYGEVLVTRARPLFKWHTCLSCRDRLWHERLYRCLWSVGEVDPWTVYVCGLCAGDAQAAGRLAKAFFEEAYRPPAHPPGDE